MTAICRLNVVDENITNATIVGVSCAILVLLFLIQPFGTSKIASSFAPIVIIWLLFNLAFGIYVSPPIDSLPSKCTMLIYALEPHKT